MSTRSYIGIQHNDGSVDVIYCHSDGYLSNNGKLLFENYQDPEKVQELINLGGLSCLGTSPEADPAVKKYGFLMDSKEFAQLPLKEQWAVWDNLTGSIAYHRDRGESLRITHANSLDDLPSDFMDGMEYFYLYRQAKSGKWNWYVKTVHDNGQEFIPDCIDHGLEAGMTHGHWYSLNRIMKRYYQLKAEQEKEQAKQPA